MSEDRLLFCDHDLQVKERSAFKLRSAPILLVYFFLFIQDSSVIAAKDYSLNKLRFS